MFFAGIGALAALAVPGCAPDRGTIGALLGQQPDGRLFIRDVPPGLAAARAGLLPGDEVLLIDGRDVRGMDEREVHRVLAGDVGAPVKLTIVRGDAVLHATLARTPVPGGSPP